jgi:hypothetical protein
MIAALPPTGCMLCQLAQDLARAVPASNGLGLLLRLTRP